MSKLKIELIDFYPLKILKHSIKECVRMVPLKKIFINL